VSGCLGDHRFGLGPRPLASQNGGYCGFTAGLVFACWMWSSGDLTLLENIGLALTMAVVGGIAINTAHELGHKRASSEKWLSRIALAQTGYGHFFIEHNRGHHVKVATRRTPPARGWGRASGPSCRAP